MIHSLVLMYIFSTLAPLMNFHERGGRGDVHCLLKLCNSMFQPRIFSCKRLFLQQHSLQHGCVKYCQPVKQRYQPLYNGSQAFRIGRRQTTFDHIAFEPKQLEHHMRIRCMFSFQQGAHPSVVVLQRCTHDYCTRHKTTASKAKGTRCMYNECVGNVNF